MTQKSKLRKSKLTKTSKISKYVRKQDESFNSENQDDQPLPVFDEIILNAYRLKNYHRCIKLIERILKFSQKETSIHYMILLAASYTMIGKNFRKSHQILDEVLKFEPMNSFALYGKGVALYFDGQFENSLRLLNQAIEVDEPNMERAKNLKLQVESEMTKVRVMLNKIDVKVADDLEENIESFVVSKIEKKKENEKKMEIKETDDDLKELSMEIDEELSPKIICDAAKDENLLENDKNAEEKKPDNKHELDLLKGVKENKTESSIVEKNETENKTCENSIDNTKLSKTAIKIDENLKDKSQDNQKSNKSQKMFDDDFTPRTSSRKNNSKLITSDIDLNSSKTSDPDYENNSTLSSNADISFDSSFVISSPKPKPKMKKIFKKISKKLKRSKRASKILQKEGKSSLQTANSSLNISITNSVAQQHFTKGLDLYMTGEFQKAMEQFTIALKLEPDFEEADEMITKSQEIIELNDVAEMNMSEKNYAAVIEILNQALEIDESNDFVNRNFYFQRGLAFYHLNENENSMKDYEEYERLSKKLGMEIKKVN